MSGHSSALLRQLRAALPRSDVRFTHIRSRSWASATFDAVRHEITVDVAGRGAEDEVNALTAELDDRDWPMPRHILVEIAITSRVDHPGHVRLEIEALTIEDA